MRHFITNITVTIITLLLISVASLWAFVRSEQLIITTEKDFENQRFIAATEPSEEEWMEIGEAVYTRNCADRVKHNGWPRQIGSVLLRSSDMRTQLPIAELYSILIQFCIHAIESYDHHHNQKRTR